MSIFRSDHFQKRTSLMRSGTSDLCRFCCKRELMACVEDDSVALTRFAAEAGDDGAAESRPEAAVLFIFS